MKILFHILRTTKEETIPYMQSFLLDVCDENATVATALTAINENTGALTDLNGRPVSRITWECSCLQKKCGACAMVINGRPQLACAVRLRDLKKGKRMAAGSKNGEGIREVTLKPLSKFPVVEDLMVDRSILRENLKQMEAWFADGTIGEPADQEMAYEASRCLQCGCCLEVCPNFYAKGDFGGMAAFVPVARLLSEMKEEERGKLGAAYRKHIYEGCGKSLACRNVCPAGIDIDGLLVNSNAMSIWKRKLRVKKE